MNRKFKVGDAVRVVIEDDSRASDFESDLILSMEDGGISGVAYGAIWCGITDGHKAVVSAVEEDGYEIQFGKHKLPFLLEDNDLTTFAP